MYQFSDSDTPDSDDGRRFKTESTRKKIDKNERNYAQKHRSPSPKRSSDNSRRDRRRTRSRSPKRESTRHKDNRSRRHDEYSKSSRHNDEKKNGESKLASGKLERSKRKDYEDSSKKHRDNGKIEDITKLKSKTTDEIDLRNKTESYGPSLPPTLSKNILNENEVQTVCKESSSSYGQKTNEINEKVDSYGPSLPPSLTKKEPTTTNKNLPKHEEKTAEESVEKTIGPSLPPHLREKLANAAVEMPQDDVEMTQDDVEILEDVEEDNEVEDMYGPLPPGVAKNSEAHIALEERALQMKIDSLTGPGEDTVKREEWMLELPAVRAANLGLGPRQFRAKPAPDMSNRSAWTETPEDKIKKQTGQKKEEVDIRKEAEFNQIRKRDEEQEKMIKKHKKNSKKDGKSLLEIHQAKLKDKKKDEDSGVRRPFSREIDLKVNRFDDAQKKSILKKAQLLDTRFSSGQSKFL